MRTRSETRRFRSLNALTAEVVFFDGGGVQLQLKWDSKVFMRLGLNAVADMHKEVRDAPAEVLADVDEDSEDVAGAAMARAYSRIRRKYDGQAPPPAKPGTKYWPAMVKAAAMAQEAGVDCDTWVEAITSQLTSWDKDQNIKVPWPNQLCSDNAPLWVSDYKVQGQGNPDADGARRAKANAGLSLDRDEEYKAIRLRMKYEKHTRVDLAYLKTRQREIYGAPKEWVARFESTCIDAVKRMEER